MRTVAVILCVLAIAGCQVASDVYTLRLVNDGKYERAIARLNARVEHFPNEVESYQFRAMALCGAERFDQAIEDCTRGLQLDTKNTALLLMRGVSYEALERHREAIDDFSQGISVAPESDVRDAFYPARANAYLKTRQFDLALEDCNRAIALGSEDQVIYKARADAWEGLGQPERAAADRAQAEELSKAPESDQPSSSGKSALRFTVRVPLGKAAR